MKWFLSHLFRHSRTILSVGLLVLARVTVAQTDPSVPFPSLVIEKMEPKTGYVQVVAPPGVTVFLDGDFKGKTTADFGGLIIEGVTAGTRKLKAVSSGLSPKETEMLVAPGAVVKWVVGGFVPRINVAESGDVREGGIQALGSLVIRSLPIEVGVSIPALDLDLSKSKDKMMMTPVPAGEYQAIFTSGNRRVEGKFVVLEKRETEVFVDFLVGKVIDLSAEQRRLLDERMKLAEASQKQEEADRKAKEEETRMAAEEKRIAAEKEVNATKGRLAEAMQRNFSLKRPWTVPSIGAEMLWCPPGTFQRGSPPDEKGREPDETLHPVALTRGFWLGKYELTQEQWAGVAETSPSLIKGPKRPVENVSWEEARLFCVKLTEMERKEGRVPEGWAYALPTEAQWEYACRGGTRTAFAFGDGLSPQDAHFGVSKQETVAVGGFRPNARGFHDMHGNVFEWCADWYGNYPVTSVVDPTGPPAGVSRVRRGGAAFFDAGAARSANRHAYGPDRRLFSIGFRLSFRPVIEAPES